MLSKRPKRRSKAFAKRRRGEDAASALLLPTNGFPVAQGDVRFPLEVFFRYCHSKSNVILVPPDPELLL